MRFVHAADLHIDSPLRGLEQYAGAPVKKAREATRLAFVRVIDLCLDERAAFLILAGDLFDGDWKDFNTALFVVSQLARLKEAGTPVFIVLGNHDRQSDLTPRIVWPENVKVFSSDAAETFVLESLGVALHGRSFPSAAVTENLSATYPAPIPGMFNIGVLHTNASGAREGSEHKAYAPSSVAELAAKGYAYWALGHVHGHEILHVRPHIVYPGNTQARHVKEQGAKGAVVIDVDAGEVARATHVACDVMRWSMVKVVAEEADDPHALLLRAKSAIAKALENADGRTLAVRLTFEGKCAAHPMLARLEDRARFVADVRAAASDVSDNVWVEKVILATAPRVNLEARRAGHDLVGDLLRETRALGERPLLVDELAPLFQSLRSKLAAGAG
ncbi:MAG: DNA repair exonuclease, partial [Polyangiaceae bacterium]